MLYAEAFEGSSGMKSAILLLALTISANAADSKSIGHQKPGKITCAMVREAVAIVGEVEAEKMAREVHTSEARIERARRCLKP
jgi:predicted outer membrane protein